MSKIKGLVVNAGEIPQVKELDNELKTFQDIVGGYIESLNLTEDGSILMLVNEEGKMIEGLKPNIDLGTDIIMGNVIIVGVDAVQGEFRSLTKVELAKVRFSIEELLIR